ncbi:hypothetical protein H4R18_004298, partial [Coemansia javaensis]
DWTTFVNHDQVLVDKSVAIVDVMRPRGNRVIAGLFPRRMGKSAFLSLFGDFLSVTSAMPYQKRRDTFASYSIAIEHPGFFEEHFGRYPVLRLDFKRAYNVPDAYLDLGDDIGVLVDQLKTIGANAAGVPMHPFERAFGFTWQDVWGLIDKYVDTQWSGRGRCPNLAEFKAGVLAVCLRDFTGHPIGNTPQIFSPYSIMRFVGRLEVESIKTEPIKTESIDDLASLAAGELDDDLISSLLPPNRIDVDEHTGKEIAEACMSGQPNIQADIGAGLRLGASTIMQLLYQAGYLAPIAGGRVGIPNAEVHKDLKLLYAQIAEKYHLDKTIG